MEPSERPTSRERIFARGLTNTRGGKIPYLMFMTHYCYYNLRASVSNATGAIVRRMGRQQKVKVTWLWIEFLINFTVNALKKFSFEGIL